MSSKAGSSRSHESDKFAEELREVSGKNRKK